MNGILVAFFIFGLLALIVVALWLPMRLCITVDVEGLHVVLTVQVSYGGMARRRTWRLPVLPPQHSQETAGSSHFSLNPQLIDEAIWAYRLLNRITDRLWHRMVVKDFTLSVRVGTGDAAQTALWMGRLTDLTAWWIGIRIAPRATKPPAWVVIPDWDEEIFAGKFTSIIQLRPSDIIFAIVYGLLGHLKGGQPSYGQSVQQHHQSA